MEYSAKSPPAVLDEDASSSAFRAGDNTRFPIAFNIYYDKTQKVTTSTFHLGEHKSQPLYVAAFYSKWTGKSYLTLHDGPSTDAPALATAETGSRLSLDSILKIPAPHAGVEISERLHVEYHLTGESHHFSVPSPAGDGTLPERFEWRQSRRDGSWGWKLVRATSKVYSGSGKGPDPGAGESSSDGKEVVASFVDKTTLSNKVAKFEFQGSGATGELGDAFSIIAVLTALRLWQMRYFLMAA